MTRLSTLALLFTALCLSGAGIAHAQCNFTVSGLVTNLSCFGANDGAINLTVGSSGGAGATGYCLPTYTQAPCNCPSTWDHISNVSTTGGSTNISNLNSGCNGNLPNNYAFFPAQVVTVNPGSSFNITVQSATSATGCSSEFSQGFRVWIDWNNDGDFGDAGEDVWNSGTSGLTPFNGTINVPANASCGPKRMRVRCTYAMVPTDPCTQYTYGETEDYTVQVGPPITYIWSNGATTEDISGLEPGAYSVTVTDGISTSTLNFVVGQPTQVTTTISANGPTTICPGQSLTLTASGQPSWTYTWSTAAATSSITINQPGTYTVTVSNSNGCSATDDIVITSATSTSPPTITPQDTSLICQGTSITLSVPASYNPTWQPGGQTTASINVTTSGQYYVTYTDAAGCTGQSQPATVIVIPPPTVTITPSGPTSFCEGGSVTLTSNYPLNNQWSTGAVSTVITVTQSGTYGLTVSAGPTCSDDDSIVVTVHPLPNAAIAAGGPTSFCQGGSVILTANPQNATYQWSNGSALSQISVNTTSTHSVTVTDSNGCTAAAGPINVTVNPIPPVPTINPAGPISICAGSSATLTSSYLTGNSWSNGQAGGSINVTQTGNYSVTYTDANGCSSASTPVSVTVNPVPLATFTAPSSACVVDNATITYTGGASAAASFQWDFGQANVVSGSGQGPYTLSFPGTGSFAVSLVVTENGCTSTPFNANIAVNATPDSDFTIANPVICAGATFSVSYIGSAPANATYNWNFGGATVISGSGPGPYVVQGSAAGGYQVSLIVVQGSCESETNSQVVQVNALPVVNLWATQTADCDTLFAQFHTNDYGGTYQWSFGNGAASTQMSPMQTYTPGVYDVSLSVVDANGCTGSVTMPDYISVYATPLAAFTSTPPLRDTIEMDDAVIAFNNNSMNAVTYDWDFGDGFSSNSINPVHAYLQSGVYTVQLIASNPLGCSDTAVSEAFFVAPGSVLFVPNLFTPNNDGVNDVFRVYANMVKRLHVMVYDRLGQKVFETRDPDAAWDGTFKGHKLNSGVFVWYCKIEYLTGRVEEHFGDVTLLR